MADIAFYGLSGDIAQLVERTDRTREVRGSNPLISKSFAVDTLCSWIGELECDVYKHKMSFWLHFQTGNGKMSVCGLLAQVARAHP